MRIEYEKHDQISRCCINIWVLVGAPVIAFAYIGEDLAPSAKVSIEQARAIALKAVPGTITDEELEEEAAAGCGTFDTKRGAKTGPRSALAQWCLRTMDTTIMDTGNMQTGRSLRCTIREVPMLLLAAFSLTLVPGQGSCRVGGGRLGDAEQLEANRPRSSPLVYDC